MYQEQPQSNLYNLYTQYGLLSKPSLTKAEDDLLNKLNDMLGSTPLKQFCAETGLTKEEVMTYYVKGEQACLSQNQDITILILLSQGFLKRFLITVMKYSSERISARDLADFLSEFVIKHAKHLHPMETTAKQGMVGWLTNAVLLMSASRSDVKNDTSPIIAACKGFKKVIDDQKIEKQIDVDEIVVEPLRFFQIANILDSMQGTVKIKGVTTILRDLIDVCAYLTSNTIVKESKYIEDGEFVAYQSEDKYLGPYNNYYPSHNYTEFLQQATLIPPNNSYYGKPKVVLFADHGGYRVISEKDKNDKKTTYHRLVHYILEKSHKTLYEFILGTVRYSNMLTASEISNSNTPLFRYNFDYSNVLSQHSREFLIDLLGEEVFCSQDFKILNNASLSTMISISDIESTILQLHEQLKQRGINWYHLKAIYKEYKNNPFRDSFPEDQGLTQLNKCLKFVRPTEVSNFCLANESTQQLVTPKFNDNDSITALEKMVIFFKNPTKENIYDLLGIVTMVDIPSDELYETMDVVFQTNTKQSLFRLIDIVSANLKKLRILQEQYYITDSSFQKREVSYSLIFALRYDYCVRKIKTAMSLIMQYTNINIVSVSQDSLDEVTLVATNLLRNFTQKFSYSLDYCIPQSSLIDRESIQGKYITVEQAVDEYLHSAMASKLRQLLKQAKDLNLPHAPLDQRYNVDQYQLYRTKASNDLILEIMGSDAEYRERRRIKNIYGLNIYAVKEFDGRWVIERG